MAEIEVGAPEAESAGLGAQTTAPSSAQNSADLEAALAELQNAIDREKGLLAHARELERALAEVNASFLWRLLGSLRRNRVFRKVWPLARYGLENGARGLVRLLVRKFSSLAHNRGAVALQPFDRQTAGVSPASARGEVFDIVFFIGCWAGESRRYRVFNVAEALAAKGLKIKLHAEAQCYDLVEQEWGAKVIVFFRTPYQERFRIGATLRYARRMGARIVFDVDDLVFEPEIIKEIHGVSLLSPAEKAGYIDGVFRYRRLLEVCDLATVTTAPLARAVEAVGIPARIIPNSLNSAQIEAADGIIAAKPARRDRLTVGYFSGSRTHEVDFAQAEPALLALMGERDDFDLLIVGFLDLGKAWTPFQHRIRRQAFMPPLEMLAVLGGCDINIAPLEVGARFCEAKSELKYFEAALVETPTIASPTEPFVAAIEHGVTGFIAATPDDWRDALSRLLDDPALRKAVGQRGRVAALDKFGVEALAEAALAAYFAEDLPKPSPVPVRHGPQTRLAIDWIVPRLIVGGGGHRNILRAAHHLQSFGHDVALHFTSSDDQADELKGLITQHFYPFEGAVKAYDGQFRESDVIIATHWTTVDAAIRARSRTQEIMYFVQDFEPAFAPMGSEYVLAENTYRLGLYCITSGPWCERLLKQSYGAEADHFRFPVDRDVYRSQLRTKPNRNVVFFAKPDMPRRCFEIGAMSLAQFHRLRPDVEIILFGSGAIERSALDFPATLLKIVPTIDDLAQMYANADLGIVFSTTNPSLVPYEMMASGCAVVDLDRPGNEFNYDGRRDIAFLADPVPEQMAAQIAQLLDRSDELTARRRNGLAFAETFPTELEMARRVEQLIQDRLNRRFLG